MRHFTKLIYVILSCILFIACQKETYDYSPAVDYRIEGLNQSLTYQNGDSLYGRIVINEDSLIAGTAIKKIDCRLGNIVIGTTENAMVCPFGVRLKDKPIGTHTFSVIIKCEAPACDETFWRYDFKMIKITE